MPHAALTESLPIAEGWQTLDPPIASRAGRDHRAKQTPLTDSAAQRYMLLLITLSTGALRWRFVSEILRRLG